jgi:hypothetical protein
MLTKKTPINPKKFFCVSCNFSCSNKKDYTRHEITSKHKILTNTNENTPKTPKAYLCACGKEYKHASSLCGHKKKCFFLQNDKEEKEIVEEKKEEGPDYKELLILAMTQMQRKDELVSEAMTEISEMRKENNQAMTEMSEMRKENNQLVTQNNELVTKMTDMVPKITEMMPSINNTNSNNTTNNTFNLQFFLNETCKDALNLTDFINSLQLQLKDLEYTANNGHIKGITNIFKTALSNMEENKRPMHCTDLKREIMYIKENDEWNKDVEKEKMKGTINQITNKNIGNIEEWLEKYPGHINPNSPDFDRFVKMTSNCMGTGNEADDVKIVRNIMREVTIDKNV